MHHSLRADRVSEVDSGRKGGALGHSSPQPPGSAILPQVRGEGVASGLRARGSSGGGGRGAGAAGRGHRVGRAGDAGRAAVAGVVSMFMPGGMAEAVLGASPERKGTDVSHPAGSGPEVREQ
jgi:hypothetical protein